MLDSASKFNMSVWQNFDTLIYIYICNSQPRSTHIVQFCAIVSVVIVKTHISHFESKGERENATPKLEIDGPSIISDL